MQPTKSIPTHQAIIQKWTKAVVHLEALSSVAGDQLIQKWTNKEIDDSIFLKENERLTREAPRYGGTAIYLEYKNQYYLITARHVLEDPLTPGEPFSRFFLVENGSNVSSSVALGPMMDHLKAGPVFGRRYIMSTKDQDIALINLSKWPAVTIFLNALKERGYVPISIGDIDTANKYEAGKEVISIGFPAEATVGQKHQDLARSNWESPTVSLPVVTFGTLRNDAMNAGWFSANIFVYHGNSGGPIIQDNKLIGIVSGANSLVKSSGSQKLEYYIDPQVRLIKAELILPLLRELSERP